MQTIKTVEGAHLEAFDEISKRTVSTNSTTSAPKGKAEQLDAFAKALKVQGALVTARKFI